LAREWGGGWVFYGLGEMSKKKKRSERIFGPASEAMERWTGHTEKRKRDEMERDIDGGQGEYAINSDVTGKGKRGSSY